MAETLILIVLAVPVLLLYGSIQNLENKIYIKELQFMMINRA